MAGKPVATIGSMHVCPMCSGTVPHVGGPVTGPGQPNVLINGKPVATVGDMCTCVGPPDTIVQGNPFILVNGKPIATMGSMTAHGGTITIGEPTVMVSSNTPNDTVTMPLKEIPFPKIRAIDVVGAALSGQGENLKKAKENISELKRKAENDDHEPQIYNLQWVKEESIIRDSKVIKKVLLRANVLNIGDGQSISFKLFRHSLDNDTTDEEQTDHFVELTGTVKDKMVEVEWEVEDPDQEQKNSE